MTMDGGNDRLWQISKAFDGLGLEVGARRALTLGDIGEVVARGKASAGAAHDYQADAVGLLRDRIDMRAQLDEHFDVDRVELVGAIEGKRREPVFIIAQNQTCHIPSSKSIIRDLITMPAVSPNRRQIFSWWGSVANDPVKS
jgi:hypothetical protein